VTAGGKRRVQEFFHHFPQLHLHLHFHFHHGHNQIQSSAIAALTTSCNRAGAQYIKISKLMMPSRRAWKKKRAAFVHNLCMRRKIFGRRNGPFFVGVELSRVLFFSVRFCSAHTHSYFGLAWSFFFATSSVGFDDKDRKSPKFRKAIARAASERCIYVSAIHKLYVSISIRSTMYLFLEPVLVCVYLCNEHVTKLLCSQNSYNRDKNKKPRPTRSTSSIAL